MEFIGLFNVQSVSGKNIEMILIAFDILPRHSTPQILGANVGCLSATSIVGVVKIYFQTIRCHFGLTNNQQQLSFLSFSHFRRVIFRHKVSQSIKLVRSTFSSNVQILYSVESVPTSVNSIYWLLGTWHIELFTPHFNMLDICTLHVSSSSYGFILKFECDAFLF